MTYTQLIEELFSKRRRLVPKALQLIKVAAQSLGNPQQNYPTIHIAGTNGKGSVTTKIAKTLEYAGYRVGLFTSPHIDHFGERMQVNGAPNFGRRHCKTPAAPDGEISGVLLF
jgi:dihydrofolate synthase/folylpolyglutamate synthase